MPYPLTSKLEEGLCQVIARKYLQDVISITANDTKSESLMGMHNDNKNSKSSNKNNAITKNNESSSYNGNDSNNSNLRSNCRPNPIFTNALSNLDYCPPISSSASKAYSNSNPNPSTNPNSNHNTYSNNSHSSIHSNNVNNNNRINGHYPPISPSASNIRITDHRKNPTNPSPSSNSDSNPNYNPNPNHSNTKAARSLREFFVTQIETDTSIIYGDGFREVEMCCNVLGLEVVLEVVRDTKKLPNI
jgi:hypothetical protein